MPASKKVKDEENIEKNDRPKAKTSRTNKKEEAVLTNAKVNVSRIDKQMVELINASVNSEEKTKRKTTKDKIEETNITESIAKKSNIKEDDKKTATLKSTKIRPINNKEENKQKTKEGKTSQADKNDKSKKIKNKTQENNESVKEPEKISKKEALEIRQMLEVQETVKKEMKQNKEIPKNELSKIYKNVFQNMCLAIVIILYLNFVILGFINIKQNVLITDLKVFGVAILVIAIAIIEKAYKEESKTYLAYAIETAILAIVTIAFIYLNIIMPDKVIPIVVLIGYIYAIYYTLKSIIIYTRMKKNYYMNAMKNMIKK